MHLDAQIESILFYKAEPVKVAHLARLLFVSEGDIVNALATLEQKYVDRGLVLIHKDDEVLLATTPATSELLENMVRDELASELGKAALETLTIVLYRGPVTRGDIDYIRGVNSNFILRSLLIRGLVEKIPNPSDARGYLYRTSFDTLAHLGISRVEELPGFDEVGAHIKKFEVESREEAKPLGEQSGEQSPIPEDAPEDAEMLDDESQASVESDTSDTIDSMSTDDDELDNDATFPSRDKRDPHEPLDPKPTHPQTY